MLCSFVAPAPPTNTSLREGRRERKVNEDGVGTEELRKFPQRRLAWIFFLCYVFPFSRLSLIIPSSSSFRTGPPLPLQPSLTVSVSISISTLFLFPLPP